MPPYFVGGAKVHRPIGSGDLRYFVGSASYPELEHSAPDGVRVEMEKPAGSPGSLDHTAGPRQGGEDVASVSADTASCRTASRTADATCWVQRIARLSGPLPAVQDVASAENR